MEQALLQLLHALFLSTADGSECLISLTPVISLFIETLGCFLPLPEALSVAWGWELGVTEGSQVNEGLGCLAEPWV